MRRMRTIELRFAVPLLLILTLAPGCGRRGEEVPSGPLPVDLTGTWRAVLASPGGDLPFTLVIRADEDGTPRAVAVNGAEEAPFSSVRMAGEEVVLDFAWYDSEITARIEDEARRLVGRWRRTSPGGSDTVMPFIASRDDERRFLPLAEVALTAADDAAAVASVDGVWSVTFRDEDGSEPAEGEFHQQGTRVTGTFLTPTGDYRFLDGSYEGGVLRLSTFDGAHAFLFHARAQEDGSLAGDFWSRDSYHATWTAYRKAAGETVLPDAWKLARVTNPEGRFRFDFEDLDGRRVTQDDRRFAGKVVLVNIFGSWCPNCNDEAPLLAEWYRRYRDRGLEIVGLAYEFTGDPERDRKQVRRFGERYGIEYPLLLAGTSDKALAAETLPDLNRIVAYPTSVFIGRDGKVRKIYSGFAGPGTGEHHRQLVAELEALIESLLAENA